MKATKSNFKRLLGAVKIKDIIHNLIYLGVAPALWFHGWFIGKTSLLLTWSTVCSTMALVCMLGYILVENWPAGAEEAKETPDTPMAPEPVFQSQAQRCSTCLSTLLVFVETEFGNTHYCPDCVKEGRALAGPPQSETSTLNDLKLKPFRCEVCQGTEKHFVRTVNGKLMFCCKACRRASRRSAWKQAGNYP